MQTTEQKNSIFKGTRDPKNSNTAAKNSLINEELGNIDKMKQQPQSNKEAAELGYTVRNGYDPNKPNPDQDLASSDDDDLDDFHTDKDLEHDEIDEDDFEEENDELDNPRDILEDDFNEIEDLEDLDQDEDEDEDDDSEEENVTEEDFEENYPANDPRKF